MGWFDWTEKIDLLAYEKGTIILQSDHRLRSGSLRVDCRLGALEHVKARIQVLEEVPTTWELRERVESLGYQPREHFYRGRLVEPVEAEAYFAQLLDPLDQQRRRAPRLAHRFQVLSRDIPGYRALTSDISETGIGLETEGPLEPHQHAHLQLELDSHHEPVELDAEVRWCRQDAEGKLWKVGAAFEHNPPQALRAYLEDLATTHPEEILDSLP